MNEPDYAIPTNKRGAYILCAVMLIISICFVVFSTISYHDDSIPDDLVEISCSFQSYNLDRHTRSSSYDLLLYSSDYELPFELSFFDGYKKEYSPDDFCTGHTYSMQVLPVKNSYIIYYLWDASGNLLMAKREAYVNSQGTAHIILTVFLFLNICYWLMLLLIIYRPDLFGERIRKFYFAKKKHI